MGDHWQESGLFLKPLVVLQTFIRFSLSFGIPVFFVWIADKLPLPRIKKLLLFMK